MSTNFSPLFRNTSGHTQRFGAEETLTWDFTSATGDPMVLLVGGATYFTFGRGGTLLIESNITWNADTGGDVGALYDHRPDNVSAASMLAVGAISAGSPGAKLQLNTLTLGHGNVNKYVDAEQGLGNTPFMRYNAVNTRWEFSDDGITATAFSAGFGTTTWDALYAADKTLIVDSTVLTFNQTATTGVAFQVVRNLASASTANPILLAEQQNAGDDQPALAVAQVATAASALDIYEGLQATGTIRYGFGAAGKLTITTKSSLADSAIHIVQNDIDDSFATFEGTSGAGASVNISTDNGATADMIQVTVDGGASVTRWIPAYSSTTLPAAPTWDAIYAGSKTLDIDSLVLTFDQSSTSGIGFTVSRNLAAAFTNDPIMNINQINSLDDQAALLVSGGIADVSGEVPVLNVLATSAGMASPGDIMVGVQSTAVKHASDAGGSFARAYQADISGAVGSVTAIGYYAGTGFASGIYCKSPVDVILPASGGTIGLTVSVEDLTADGIQVVGIGANTGNAIYVDANWTYGFHNDSPSLFDGASTFTAAATHTAALKVSDDVSVLIGTGEDAQIVYSTTQVPDSLLLGLSTDSRSVVVCEKADTGTNFAHALQTDPTIFIQSADATNVGEFLGLSYLGLSANAMTTDKAAFDLTLNAVDACTGAAVNNDGGNILLKSGAADSGGIPGQLQVSLGSDPVLTHDVMDVTLTSGGANGATEVLTALKINTAGHASDTNDLPIKGLVLDHTAGAGSENSAALTISGGYASGIWLDSAPGASAASILACNDAASASSTLMLLADGTIAGLGGATVNRFLVQRDGVASVNADNAADALTVHQNDTGGSARLLYLNDANASVVRLKITQVGNFIALVNSAVAALSVQQDGAGGLFEFKDGSTSRMTLSEPGAVLLSTSATLGSEALHIDQNDFDKAFINYEGDIAASSGYDSGKNIQEWKGGSGAVEGPLGQSVAEAYWFFQGMVKTEVNGAEYWMPYYGYSAS